MSSLQRHRRREHEARITSRSEARRLRARQEARERCRARALFFEQLESRVVLSTTPVTAVLDPSATSLTLTANVSGTNLTLTTDSQGLLEYSTDGGSMYTSEFVGESGSTFQVNAALATIIYDADSSATLTLVNPKVGPGLSPGTTANTIATGETIQTNGASLTIKGNGDVVDDGTIATGGGALTITTGGDLTIDGSMTTGGGDLKADADSGKITVGDTNTLSLSTEDRDAQGRTAGDSGAITLTAQFIATGNVGTSIPGQLTALGATAVSLLASVDPASVHAAGAITLDALNQEDTLYANIGVHNSYVDLVSTTISGGDVTVGSDSEVTRSFNPIDEATSTSDPSVGQDLLGIVTGGLIPDVGLAVARTDAEVTLGAGTDITASGDVKVTSYSASTGQFFGLGFQAWLAADVTDATARVDAQDGSSISAAGNVTIGSSTTTNQFVLGIEAPAVEVAPTDFVAAVSVVNSTAATTVDQGATVTAGGYADLSSLNDKELEVSVSGGGSSDMAGLGIVYSQATTDAHTLVNGTVTASGTATEPPAAQGTGSDSGTTTPADGDVVITADSEQASDVVNADLLVGNDFWTPLINPLVGSLKGAISWGAQKTGLALSSAAAGLVGRVSGSSTLSGLVTKLEGLGDALSTLDLNTSETSTPALAGLGACVAIANQSNTATAEVGSTGVVQAAGQAQVHATIDAPVQLASTSLFQPAGGASSGQTSSYNLAAAAVAVGRYSNDCQALIDHQATVDGTDGVDVHAQTKIPFQTSFINLPSYDGKAGDDTLAVLKGLPSLLNGNLGVQAALFTSWAQAASYGQTSSTSGSVDVMTFDNTTNASIGTGAQINQDQAYRPKSGSSAKQDVNVQADTSFSTVNLSGTFNPFANLSVVTNNIFANIPGKYNPFANPQFALSKNFAGASGDVSRGSAARPWSPSTSIRPRRPWPIPERPCTRTT